MLEFVGNTFGLALNLEQDSVGAVVLGAASLGIAWLVIGISVLTNDVNGTSSTVLYAARLFAAGYTTSTLNCNVQTADSGNTLSVAVLDNTGAA